MIKTAKNVPNGESPFLLIYTVPAGAHAVVGYGQEDGAVTIGDAVLPARLVAGDSTLQIDKAAVSNGDMDKNGMFTANDMTLILNRITGIS